MRGRKPKPTELKRLAGNPGKRPLNNAEPRPRVVAPRPPAHLSDGDERLCPHCYETTEKYSVADLYIDHLERLMQATEEILQSAITAPSLRDQAVNWADLHCTEAKKYFSFASRETIIEGYEVCIEEVSPNADKLRAYVSTALEAKGFENVTVTTEW